MATRGQFSSLDTFQVVQELSKSIVNHRINNFYDVGPKTFVMRFGAADSKHRVVFEPGVRCHATEVDHEKPKIPSHFTLLIRKHIRGWRCRSVTQVGRDRVIDFGFGGTQEEPPQFHLFIELWGQGNIILTDANTKIVALWRTMKSQQQQENNKSDESSNKKNQQQQAASATASAVISGSTNKRVGDLYISSDLPSTAFQKITKEIILEAFLKSASEASPLSINSLLPTATYGLQLMKHINLSAAPSIDFTKSIPKILAMNKLSTGDKDDEKTKSFLTDLAGKIASGFDEVDQAYGLFSSSSSAQQTTTNGGAFAFSNKSSQQQEITQYIAFAKLPLKQYTSQQQQANNFVVTPTPTFSAAADLLFSAEERKKLSDIARKQPTAQSREERVRASIQRRIVELENEGAQRRKCANALLLASEEVDKVVTLLSDALALGTPWKTLTEAIRRQREAAAEEEEKKRKKKYGEDDEEDEDDDKIDLGSDDSDDSDDDDSSASDSSGAEDLFMESDEDEDNDSDDDSDNDGSSDDDSDNQEEESEQQAKARAADEQRYLLSLIYALDLRKNQMTLQLPDPDHSFDYSDDDENETEEDFEDRFLGGPKVVLVVVDIGLSAHENATKYFELAKKADRSKAKTEDKEEEAVLNAKKAGKKDDKKNKNSNKKELKDDNKNSNEANKKKGQGNIPKQREANSERQPAWFERHFWFMTSMGDLVILPKDAGQADVLVQKFTNRSQDIAILVDEFGSWPTIVKPRAALAEIAAKSSSSSSSSSSYKISNTSLLEAAAATLCRSNVGNGWTSTKAAATAQLKQQQLQNKKNQSKQVTNKNKNNSSSASNAVSAPSSSGSSSCVWCPAACLTKAPQQGSGIKTLPQGAWSIMKPEEFKKPLQLAFSSQLCIALVEASSSVNAEDEVQHDIMTRSSENEEKFFDVSSLVKKVEETCADTPAQLTNVPGSASVGVTTSSIMSRQESVASSITTAMDGPQNNNNKNNHQQQQQQQQQLSDAALKRQQKKAKMIQKKYGEQDDEDRAIALALIGTKKSKAQEMLEKEDQLPSATTVAQQNNDKKNKKKKKNQEDNNDENEEEIENIKKEKSVSQQQENASSKANQQQQQQQQKKQQQQQQPRQLSDEAQKNLQEKIQTAATEFMTMRYVDSSSEKFFSQNNNNNNSSSPRYLVPVLVPLLTMPMNKCRVLLVPGSEKRAELARELQKNFFVPLAEHLAKICSSSNNSTTQEEDGVQSSTSTSLSRFSSYPSLVSQMTNDDIMLQLPMTGKIQTPFRASLVQI